VSAVPPLGDDERRLLLDCARVELDAEREAEVRQLLSQRLDWEAVLFFARLHSVGSLLHRHVKRLGDGEAVPATARRGLLALYQRAAYRNRVFAGENAALVNAFHAAGIPVIIQKGLPVADLTYGGLALRPLIDLIYLVRPGQLSAAGEVLLEQGYSARATRLRKAVYDWCCPQAWFVKDDGFKVPVLVKAQLVNWAPRYRLTPDRVWADARSDSVAGSRVLVLSPVDLVLYLCVNADHHGFFNHAALGKVEPTDLLFGTWSHNRLVRFSDIHEVVRRHRDTLDWDALVERARSCRVEAAAHTSLVLTERLLGQAAPREVLDRLSPDRGLWLRRGLMAVAAEQRPRTSGRGLRAGLWRRLGPNGQLGLMWMAGLAEMFAVAGAGRSLLRSAWSFVLALTWSPSGPRRAAAAQRRRSAG
jgi:Uncharacterised nucleotidyltransferase